MGGKKNHVRQANAISGETRSAIAGRGYWYLGAFLSPASGQPCLTRDGSVLFSGALFAGIRSGHQAFDSYF